MSYLPPPSKVAPWRAATPDRSTEAGVPSPSSPETPPHVVRARTPSRKPQTAMKKPDLRNESHPRHRTTVPDHASQGSSAAAAGTQSPKLSPPTVPSRTRFRVVPLPPTQELVKQTHGRLRIFFKSPQLDLTLPVLTTSRSAFAYTTPHFTLRAARTDRLPADDPSPFPEEFRRDLGSGRQEKTVRLGIVASKSKVSNLATERNRVKRRLREVVRAVVDKGVGVEVVGGGSSMSIEAAEGEQGMAKEGEGEKARGDTLELLSDKWTYIAFTNQSLYLAPFAELCADAARALVALYNKTSQAEGNPAWKEGAPWRQKRIERNRTPVAQRAPP